jgi:hypothetical protein
LENTELKAKAIFNKLEKARKQLTADQPDIIFVKTPPRWMAAPEFVSTTVEQAHALCPNRAYRFRQFYVAPTAIEGGYVTQQHAYRELSNPKTRFGFRN